MFVVAACTTPTYYAMRPPQPVTTGASASVSFQQLVDGFATLESCEASTSRTSSRCMRTLTLCENGRYVLVTIDAINKGRYDRDGDRVRAKQRGPGDGPGTFSLTLSANSFESRELAGTHPWTKVAIDEATSTCAQLAFDPALRLAPAEAGYR